MADTPAQILIKDVWNENPVFRQVLGICSALAVTNLLTNTLFMCLGVIFTLIMSNLTISILRNYIPKRIRMIVQVLIIFVVPMLILMASKKIKIVKTLSPILIAYAIGIVWGNIPGLPLDRGVSDLLTQVSVPKAIPLILFSADFIKWLKSAKKTVISFVLMIVSAFLAALLAAWIFRGTIDEFAKISGMMIGVYTGGTPNLMAVGMMLEAKKDTLILVSTCDSIIEVVIS